MPFVPVVDPSASPTPSVQAPNVAPMQDHSADQTQRLGATIERAGEVSMRTNQDIGLHIQNLMDEANVKAAETKFIQASTDILHGDKGYMNTRGADAINGFDGATQDIIKVKKDLLDSLGNNIQKDMFQETATRHLVTFGGQMAQHRAQQRVEYSVAQAAGRADSMRSMAMNSEIGSKDQNTYIETGVQEIQNALRAKGVPADSDQAKQAERSYRSQITQDNVSRLMEDGKYTEASALLNEQMKANNVEGDTADRLRRAIRSNVQRTEMIDAADKIFAPYKNKDLQATDLESMLQKVDQIKNPEQRQAVDGLVKARFSERHSLQQAEYRDNLNDVVNYKYSHNGSLRGLDPAKWGKLDAKDQYDLTRPEAQETDLNTWYKFRTQPDQLTLSNVNEAFSKGLLTKGDYKNFVEDAVRLTNKPDYVQQAGDVAERVKYFAGQAGLPVYGPQSPEQKSQLGTLHYKVQSDIDQIKSQNHGKITSEQVDQVIKKELTQQTLAIPRSPYSPLAIFGNKTYTEKKFGFELPKGATHVVPGSDGKMHYTDGTNDLGVVE
jgi:hypothetical protein